MWPKSDHRERDVIGLGVIPDKIVHRTDHSMANFVRREAGTTLERILHSGFSEQFLICGVSLFTKTKVGPSAQSIMTDNGAQFVTAADNGDTVTVSIAQLASMNDGKTQITIIRASKG